MFENSPEWVQFWIINPIRHLLIAVIFLIPYGLLMMWSVKNNGKMHPAVRLAANTILALPYLLLLSLGIGLLALGIVGIYALFVNLWEAKMALLPAILLLFGAVYTWWTIKLIRGADIYEGNEDEDRASGNRFMWLYRYILIFSIVSFILMAGLTEA